MLCNIHISSAMQRIINWFIELCPYMFASALGRQREREVLWQLYPLCCRNNQVAPSLVTRSFPRCFIFSITYQTRKSARAASTNHVHYVHTAWCMCVLRCGCMILNKSRLTFLIQGDVLHWLPSLCMFSARTHDPGDTDYRWINFHACTLIVSYVHR